MSRYRNEEAVALVGLMVVMVVLVLGLHSCMASSCSEACHGQYGSNYQGQSEPRTGTCDCIAPDGTIRRPR